MLKLIEGPCRENRDFPHPGTLSPQKRGGTGRCPLSFLLRTGNLHPFRVADPALLAGVFRYPRKGSASRTVPPGRPEFDSNSLPTPCWEGFGCNRRMRPHKSEPTGLQIPTATRSEIGGLRPGLSHPFGTQEPCKPQPCMSSGAGLLPKRLGRANPLDYVAGSGQ